MRERQKPKPFTTEDTGGHGGGKEGILPNQFKYDAQKQAALEAWGRKVERIANGSTGD